MKRFSFKKVAGVVVSVAGVAGAAGASATVITADVTTALGTVSSDISTIGAAVLIALVTAATFKYVRKAL